MTKSCPVAVLIATLLLVSATRSSEAHGSAHNPTRFDYVMRHGVPEAYQGLLNPLRMTPENLSSGQNLYKAHCTACHGPTGQGGGESAAVLNPPPSSLTDMYDRPMHGMGHAGPGGHLMHGKIHHHPGMSHAEAMGGLNLDAYSFWSVSEGGAPMSSNMPAFKNTLSEDERWQILLYIANDFSAGSRN